MQFLRLATILSVATAAVAATDYNTVVADIQKIQKQTNTVNASVSKFQGGTAQLPQALAIQGQTTDLDNYVKQGTKDAKASPAFGDDGSTAVANAVLSLVPDIQTALQTITNKKPAFDKTQFFGIKSSVLVLTDLKQLRSDTKSFGAAVTPKLNDVFRPLAPSILQNIDDSFASAISAYSS